MECPHLTECIKISAVPCSARENGTDKASWHCKDCDTDLSPWICLACGYLACGRYVNGHAKEHSELNPNHFVCIDCESLAAFCYQCDEFVTNDTPECDIAKLRSNLADFAPSDISTSEELCSELTHDADSHNNSIPDVGHIIGEVTIEEGQENHRVLRPRGRKRAMSEDSADTENKKQRSSSRNKNKSKDKKVVGLRNLGNTCFMNAVLQSLSNIQEFCYYFKQLPSIDSLRINGKRPPARLVRNTEADDGAVTEELRKILISLTRGDAKSAISPESLFTVIWKVVPRFRGYQQQDAHEFLRYMLDRLHTELLTLLPESSFTDNSYISLGQRGRSTIVTTIFGGMLQNEVACLSCGIESKKHDPFLDLSLDIPDRYISNKKPKDGEPPPPLCTLSGCLTSFVEVEELADTELYYCAQCKQKQKSTKKFWIRRLPNVLCLHLKRFRWSNYFRTKLDAYVQFPLKALDMSRYILTNLHETRRSGTGTNLYDLAAVIVHHGSGAGSGHYTAFAINDGVWFHFNDSTVKKVDPSVVQNSKAYILFYIRREFRLPHLRV